MSAGPVLIAYDGSELARDGLQEAARLLDASATEVLVLTVWQPFDVGFEPVEGEHFDAAQIADVRSAAAHTAAEGAKLAETAGFRQAQSAEVERSPTWKGIAEVAEDRDARLIVFGSHGRHGLKGALSGSVAGSVASHTSRSVLIVHQAA